MVSNERKGELIYTNGLEERTFDTTGSLREAHHENHIEKKLKSDIGIYDCLQSDSVKAVIDCRCSNSFSYYIIKNIKIALGVLHFNSK